MFLSFAYLISGQNETNITDNGEINLTAPCGNGIIQVELDEKCDDGNDNTDTPCQVAYGEECSYCDTNCQSQIISGGYCGDGVCQEEKEDYQNCPSDNCEIPPKNECNFDKDCKEKPSDNPCTENKCIGDPKRCVSENIDYKRVDHDKYYCLDGNLEDQKNEGDFCSENAECRSNMCSEGKCLRMKKGLLQTILEKIGLSGLYDKLKEWGIL